MWAYFLANINVLKQQEKLMKKRAIICVDDEKIVLTSIKEQLKNHFENQFVYVTSDNAAYTLELIDNLVKKEVDIIIIVSDWLMPGIKGDVLLTQIHQKFPNIITILLTGHADKKAIENAQVNANLFACIYKPWDEQVFIETIRRALETL